MSDTPSEQQPETPQPQTQPQTPPKPQDNKVIIRFKGINIPGGKSLPKGYKMSKDKTVEYIILFINKQLRDTNTTYRLYVNNCLLNLDDTIADLLNEFRIAKAELEITFSPIDNVFG
ncbi:Ubiquitin-like protein ATG12 [Entamoeba marina]